MSGADPKGKKKGRRLVSGFHNLAPGERAKPAAGEIFGGVFFIGNTLKTLINTLTKTVDE